MPRGWLRLVLVPVALVQVMFVALKALPAGMLKRPVTARDWSSSHWLSGVGKVAVPTEGWGAEGEEGVDQRVGSWQSSSGDGNVGGGRIRGRNSCRFPL